MPSFDKIHAVRCTVDPKLNGHLKVMRIVATAL
jgi:hypothetical protein